MPYGIVIASIVGGIVILWFIKRSRSKPKVEFRQDTMRYIDIDPARKPGNRQPQAEAPSAREPVSDHPATATAPEPVVSEHEAPEIDIAPKPVLAGEGGDELAFEGAQADTSAEEMFESPELLLDDK